MTHQNPNAINWDEIPESYGDMQDYDPYPGLEGCSEESEPEDW